MHLARPHHPSLCRAWNAGWWRERWRVPGRRPVSELARKLGLKPGQTIYLVEAPATSRALLTAECAAGVTLAEAPTGGGFEAVFFLPPPLDGLTQRFDKLAHGIITEGALLAGLPHTRDAPQRRVPFYW